MTENEAIEWLREMQNPMISEAELYCAETCYGLGKMVYPEPEDYVYETAIKALEEIQQYRAIGTIEEFKAYKQGNCTNDCEHYDSTAEYVRNNAIDEFAEALKELFKYESAWHKTMYHQRFVIDIDKIDEIAEQMKAGAK